MSSEGEHAMVELADLGLLHLLTEQVPETVQVGSGSYDLPTAGGARDVDGPLLVWHSPRAALSPAGPGGELRRLDGQLAERGISLSTGERFAVFTSGGGLRSVWSLEGRGLARWEVRIGLAGRGRFGWWKRLALRAFGDRLARRMRPATLVHMQSQHAH